MNVTDAAANAVLAGTSAMLVSALGVEPQAIIWAIVGSIIGVIAAPPTGKLYACAMFLAATLMCALFGTWVSHEYFAGAAIQRNMAACMLAALFHPIIKKLLESVGTVVGAWIARIASTLEGGPK